MSRPNTLSWLLLSLASLAFAPSAHAQYTIDWYTVDGGGGASVGGTFSLEGTAGQADVGFGMSAGGTLFCVTTGYWEGGTFTNTCPGDNNGDNTVNTLDLASFLGAFGQSVAQCGFGPDYNFDGLVNTQDLVVLLGNFGNVCAPVVVARP